MKKVAIMAPTFLPWAGYFDIIKKSDVFIFLDNVQFKKRSWQQRNRIVEISKQNYAWLTVPVKSKGKYFQLINEVEIDHESKNYNKIYKTLELNYNSTEYFKDFFKDIKKILDNKEKFLINLNIKLITKICEFLKIKKNFLHSSSFNISTKKSQLLFDLTMAVEGTEYISAPGSSIFFEQNNPFQNSEIKLNYHEYNCKKYNQRINKFLSHCSIIDMIFNLGEEAKKII